MLQKRHGRGRDTTIIVLSASVIDDRAGFFSVSYQRGVQHSSAKKLLSQVDFSVGGKIAVNHPLGKRWLARSSACFCRYQFKLFVHLTGPGVFLLFG
ncbi:MAG: hypothetical protein ACSLEL_01315 [Candidatus Malihini olakiniferum]